jgi:hypothetical protein
LGTRLLAEATTGSYGALTQVIHKPHVAMRAHPSTNAELLTLKEAGCVVKAEATRGEWVKVAASEIPAALRGCVRRSGCGLLSLQSYASALRLGGLTGHATCLR